MTMSVRMSEADQKLIQDFAKLYNMTASEFVRRAVMEKIEDEVDIRIAKQAYEEYEADPVTYTHDEVGRMLGLN